ncbi:hypothetical protein B5X24_HaOG205782 [Helicoverpa armigera]|nr:hypothetical protein B5X24_HaOG205782 [Helicoverpa armigera]
MMKIKYRTKNQSESIKQKCSGTQTKLNESQYCGLADLYLGVKFKVKSVQLVAHFPRAIIETINLKLVQRPETGRGHRSRLSTNYATSLQRPTLQNGNSLRAIQVITT